LDDDESFSPDVENVFDKKCCHTWGARQVFHIAKRYMT